VITVDKTFFMCFKNLMVRFKNLTHAKCKTEEKPYTNAFSLNFFSVPIAE